MIIIPDQQPPSLDRAMDRAFQLVQLRLMKDVMASMKEMKASKPSAAEASSDRELSRLMSQLLKSSQQQVKAVKGMKMESLDAGDLETAMRRAMPKMKMGHQETASMTMPAGLGSKLSHLEEAVEALTAKLGKRTGSLGASQVDRLVRAIGDGAKKSRNRTFGSNF